MIVNRLREHSPFKAASPFLAALLVFCLSAGLGAAAKKEDLLEKPFQEAAKDFQRGRFEEAARFYRIVRNTYKGSDWEARSGLYLARCYEKLGKTQEYAEVLGEVAESFPARSEGFEARCELARLAEGQGLWDQAARMYMTAVAGAPEQPLAPYALVNVGYLYVRAKQDAKALETFTRLAASYPGNAYAQREALEGKAKILRKQGNFAEAATAYQGMIQSSTGGSPVQEHAMLELGHTWAQANDLTKAARAYASLAESFPLRSAEAWLHQGLVLKQSGQAKASREILQRVIDEHAKSYWAEAAQKAIEGPAKP
jgi:TolA-binding protein